MKLEDVRMKEETEKITDNNIEKQISELKEKKKNTVNIREMNRETQRKINETMLVRRRLNDQMEKDINRLIEQSEPDKEVQELIDKTNKMNSVLCNYITKKLKEKVEELKKDKKIRQVKIVDFSLISYNDDIYNNISGKENRLKMGFELIVDFDFPIAFRQNEKCDSCGRKSYLTARAPGSGKIFCKNCNFAHITEISDKSLKMSLHRR